MKTLLPLALVALVSFAGSRSLPADPLLRNGDLSSGLSGWHGDGRLVYLNPDGSEADDSSSGAVPAIKLRLSNEVQSVYQEFETHGSPTTLNVSVEVMASGDFKRSTDASLYGSKWSPGGTWYWSADVIPTSDFFIKGAPGFFYKLSPNLKPNVWTPVKGHFENLNPTDDHTVYFCVPPGDGAVYVRNAAASQ